MELGELNRELMKQVQEDVASVDRIEQQALLLFDQQELLVE